MLLLLLLVPQLFVSAGMKFMLDSLRSLGTRGSKLIRLDAFGYATKTPGTRCFFQVSSLPVNIGYHLHTCYLLFVASIWAHTVRG